MDDCTSRESDDDLGSGGGHGHVEGGQGGGAVRVHTDVEAVIEGRLTADGGQGECVSEAVEYFEDYTLPTEVRHKYRVSRPGGGGGSGGSIWITSPRVVGRGLISAVGGNVSKWCEAQRSALRPSPGQDPTVTVVVYRLPSLCTASCLLHD